MRDGFGSCWIHVKFVPKPRMMVVSVHGIVSDKTRVSELNYSVAHASLRIQALKSWLNFTLKQLEYFYKVRKAAFCPNIWITAIIVLHRMYE